LLDDESSGWRPGTIVPWEHLKGSIFPVNQLSRQRALDLTGQQLASLPESIGKQLALEELVLDQNRLTSLPAWIGQLANLKSLSLYSNQLASLPESGWQLTNLQTLNLGENHLSALSERLGQLTLIVYRAG
jgi:Leucine-rich repeat (LRR) protein